MPNQVIKKIALLIAALPLYANAFDCSKAKTETEAAICDSSKEVRFAFNNNVTEQDCDDGKFKIVDFWPREAGKISSSGRVFFYKAPEEKCKSTNLFLVKNDRVVIYGSTMDAAYQSVVYVTKGGNIIMGWVESKNITRTGTVSAK